MKQKPKYTLDNILSFLEGNFKYYWDKMLGSPAHIQEQIIYRMDACKDDCLPAGKCIKCGCPTQKKLFVKKSCNPERFGDLMERKKWEKFKRNHE